MEILIKPHIYFCSRIGQWCCYTDPKEGFYGVTPQKAYFFWGQWQNIGVYNGTP